ncbi:chemotaxis protein CheW [Thiomicrorhabdus sp. zzn3]|uniref:chemotaxis protein CheW n=1 Tax=Thiomicrorhabdus sp. zzn3 TaxID=3039775 RepID=UPI002436B3C9|nr:chemotaxis protein CheW [Thiomicrorhabdus sp. zzn3]MDG6777807.1 chemotaxis protein CheW [Thiomicrorhabdus sp. zzn3]
MDMETQRTQQVPDTDVLKKDRRSGQYLTFLLASETYGIDILRVQEIRGWEKTTQLPSVPDYVKGVINMRGAVVPIVDLRERFHIGQATYDESTVVIITKMESGSVENLHKTIGLVVDGVSDVEDIDLASLHEAPSFQSDERVSDEYIQGLASIGDKMAIVLNVDHLLKKGVFQKLAKA